MTTNRPPKVLVTGASGGVGSRLCRQLSQAGARVRAATRDPATLAPDLAKGSVSVDLADPESLVPALVGVDAVFLLWPFFESEQEARRKVAPIANLLGQSVSRVVYLSSQGVEHDRHAFWAVVEDAIAQQVREWIMLRPTGFTANARQWAPQIARGNVVRWPFGEMARPLIHEADIAAVAVEALLAQGHQGRSYVLSGPGRITQRDQVQTIGEALGRSLEWHEISRTQAAREFELPEMMLDAWEGFVGRPEPVTNEVQRLTGRPARSFAEWAYENVAMFQ